MSTTPMLEPAAVSRGEACCVCGQTRARVWRRAGDHILGGPDTYTDLKCETCGTVRLSPRPNAAAMNRAYGPQTYARAEDGETGTSGLAHRLDVFFDRQAQRATDAFAKLAAPDVPRRVLDVGCGDGRFLHALQTRGWDGVGLETGAQAAGLARRRAAPFAIYGTPLEEANLPAQSFGMVSLLHVLEHVPNPRETLQTCYDLLAPGGMLLLALPNAGSIEAKLFGATWYPLDLPRHYWGFNPKTLLRLAGEVGFTKAQMRYLPFFFAPQSLRYSLRALRGKPVADPPTDNETPAPPEGPNKTRAFMALLNISETLGKTLPGEVMELAAVRPPTGETKNAV